MIIGVLKERSEEYRVAMVPEIMRKWPDCEFYVESNAGVKAGYSDEAFEEEGAHIEKGPRGVLERAQVVLSLGLPQEDAWPYFQPGAALVGQLLPNKNKDRLEKWASIGITSFALERLPRTTRAQAMDILSSQSNLVGYQAAVYGAAHLGRLFPLMMTAAGSLPAARVLIIGAGVAGLQAIATAKRLGAIVSAFDVRAAAKEQVESLGASFVEVHVDESGDGGGGYAKEMSAVYQAAQEARLAEVLPQQDVVITTAQIPNKPAPKIVTRRLVDTMKRGAYLLDLAGESGGNCELSKAGQEVVVEGKRIFAPLHFINQVAPTASRLLASNFTAFVKTLLRVEDGKVSFDETDELIRGTLLTHQGQLRQKV